MLFRKRSTYLLALTLGIIWQQTFAQTPALTPKNIFAAGRAALKANDCGRAVQFFAQVQPTFGRDPTFILAMAKAQQCSGNKAAALASYLQYQQLAPNVPEIDSQVGQLEYEIQRDRESAIAQAQAAQERAAEEQQARAEKSEREAREQEKRETLAALRSCYSDCNDQHDSCIDRANNNAVSTYMLGNTYDNGSVFRGHCDGELDHCRSDCKRNNR
jgi:hypothetical protein